MGGAGSGPGPEKLVSAAPAKVLPAKINVTTNIRITIFMINFLQYLLFFRIFVPRKLRIDYMKNRNALQQLTIPAIFANSPMLNIGQSNELHKYGTCRKHSCRK
jgi:hypothetical protein